MPSNVLEAGQRLLRKEIGMVPAIMDGPFGVEGGRADTNGTVIQTNVIRRLRQAHPFQVSTVMLLACSEASGFFPTPRVKSTPYQPHGM